MDELTSLVQTHKLFVDTCSLMHAGANEFYTNKLIPLLLSNKSKVIIPLNVIAEIDKNQRSSLQNTRKSAILAGELVNSFVVKGLVDIRGDAGDPFVDGIFLYVFTKFCTQYNLALFTQDTRLSDDILMIKNQKSIHSMKSIKVFHIGQSGNFYEWHNEAANSTKTNIVKPAIKKFMLCQSPASGTGKPLSIVSSPAKGDFVKSDKLGLIKLDQERGVGGEGTIYSCSEKYACKVYFKDKLTDLKLKKLRLMIENPVNIPGVCWPIDLIGYGQDKFVGYVMLLAEGQPMQKCMFVKPLFSQYFPHWTRKHLVVLAINILEKIQKLHEFNVILGDINPLNILIKSEHEVFFVDTDSYQVEAFPCPVGMVNFTAPEIQGKKYDSFLRTFEHEYFALATLLFMILLPGKPPYSQQGGEDPASNIKNGNFSYPFKEKSNKKTPDGPWRFIWSHFPYKLKKAFFDCFANSKRIPTFEWLNLMDGYLHALEHGLLDPTGEGDKLFPATFKIINDYAHHEYGVTAGTRVEMTCDECKKSFFVMENHAEKIKDKQYKYCPDCYKVKKSEGETGDYLTCKDCHKQFLFSIREQKFFQSKGFSTPQRCSECRQKHKDNPPIRTNITKPFNFYDPFFVPSYKKRRRYDPIADALWFLRKYKI